MIITILWVLIALIVVWVVFKDVSPQQFGMEIIESAANTFTQGGFNTPVIPNFASNNKALVMEILKIWFEIDKSDMADEDFIDMQITSASFTAMGTVNDAGVIVKQRVKTQFVTSGVNTKLLSPVAGVVWDLTDGDGNGQLVAAKELFIAIKGTSQAAAIKLSAAILYRLKVVNVTEYVGILAK